MESHVDPAVGPVLTALARSAIATSFAPQPPTAAALLEEVPAALSGEAQPTAALSEAAQSKTTPSDAAAARAVPPDSSEPRAVLSKRRATFVTLERDRKLRGCIGTLNALRPLGVDVVRNARLAARDPRMPPVQESEVDALQVTVTLLSPAERVAVNEFAALFDVLRPGEDGLVLKDGNGRRATFLPSVWANLPEPERFVAALLRKGRWPESLWKRELRSAAWPQDLTVERYATRSFKG
jgi:AmmeMemoRadiSam system protein A